MFSTSWLENMKRNSIKYEVIKFISPFSCMINFWLCYVTSIYICLSVRLHFIFIILTFFHNRVFTSLLMFGSIKNQPKVNVSTLEDLWILSKIYLKIPIKLINVIFVSYHIIFNFFSCTRPAREVLGIKGEVGGPSTSSQPPGRRESATTVIIMLWAKVSTIFRSDFHNMLRFHT